MKSREHELLKIIREWVSRSAKAPGVITGIGDDAAVVRPFPDKDLVITTDSLVEGIHFDRSYFDPYFIGRKLAASNFSDLGAAGARPLWAILNMGFCGALDLGFYQAFFRGLMSHLNPYGVELIGGDTVSSPVRLFFSLTLIGEVPKGRHLGRGGAVPGDFIFCSGTLGDSEGGLLLLKLLERAGKRGKAGHGLLPRAAAKRLIRRHIDPVFRLELGQALLKSGLATSTIDISDGIATDLAHISERSCVRCVLKRGSIPVSRALRLLSASLGLDPVAIAMKGGEDFELVWTVSPENAKRSRDLASKMLGHTPFCIGHIENGKGVYISDRWNNLLEITLQGFEHV